MMRRAVILSAALSLWSATPARAGAQAAGGALLRQLYGDLAFDVRAGEAGAIRIGVADDRRSVAITVLATDLRRWADSVTKVLAARPARRGQAARWDVTVSGPGVVAGSMALTRTVAPRDSGIALLVTDPDFVGVRTDLTTAEARSLAGAMGRVARAALSPGRRGRPPGAGS